MENTDQNTLLKIIKGTNSIFPIDIIERMSGSRSVYHQVDINRDFSFLSLGVFWLKYDRFSHDTARMILLTLKIASSFIRNASSLSPNCVSYKNLT